MAERITVLDTQNEVKEIAVTSDEDSIVSIKFEGDFDSGNMDVGYTDTNKSDGTFEIATGGTSTADGDFIYTIGRNQRVYARATGASPDINVKTTIVS